MILYVNGDSHSYGYDAGGPKFSYGQHIANHLGAEFVCQAKPGGSNPRIIRTTRAYLKNNKPDLIIIGWSGWEREEWEHNGYYFDVNGSGIDTQAWPLATPDEIRERYKHWVVTTAVEWHEAEVRAHQLIKEFHYELKQLEIPHLFFNCFSYFKQIPFDWLESNWGDNYIKPYDEDFTYYYWLENQGFKPSNPKFFHYGADAHLAWANFLLTKLPNESIITK